MSEPATSDQLLQQGLFHHRQGQLAQAMERYTDVLRTDPQNADALYYVAVVACQEGQFKQGVDLARRALEHGPPQARVHNLLGKAHEQLGDPLEAIKAYDQAIALDASFAEAHGNRAALLAKAGFPEQALASFDRALALDPAALPDLINRGALLQDLDRHGEALDSYDKALALAPDDAAILFNRANALARLGRFAEAEAGYDQAIRRDPRMHLAALQKGLAVKHQGRLDEARALMQQAATMQPDDATSAAALSELMLLMGDWRNAWPLFERRPVKPVLDDLPRWHGEPAGDFRLVLVDEGRLADTVLFSRYAALMAGRGHDVTLLTAPELVPLMRTLPGVERVAVRVEEIGDDPRKIRWFPLMSLMGVLHLTPDAVPAQGPYLSTEPGRSAQWAARLGDGFKVGIAWRDAETNSGASLSALAPLTQVEGVRLISLQQGKAAAEIAQVPFATHVARPLNPGEMNAESMLDTAALIANLDLIISVDALPAHIAGALGRPVFLALPAVPGWCWLTARDDTPWYPGMRLFRQALKEDWVPVFERVADALRMR